MEIALESAIPTYCGGLGVLAGDTLHACSDLRLPVVGITLVYHDGYFRQELDASGSQLFGLPVLLLRHRSAGERRRGMVIGMEYDSMSNAVERRRPPIFSTTSTSARSYSCICSRQRR